ncbi:hypothetical protein AGMMS50276_03620 [Synergistales bacterium]|nr:hypothetical protein AGMMS50276_03620 [Synergistales bacterium]
MDITDAIKILMIGTSRAGKTTYMAGAFHALHSSGVQGFRLDADDDTQKWLNTLYEGIKNGHYPSMTSKREAYNMALKYHGREILEFVSIAVTPEMLLKEYNRYMEKRWMEDESNNNWQLPDRVPYYPMDFPTLNRDVMRSEFPFSQLRLGKRLYIEKTEEDRKRFDDFLNGLRVGEDRNKGLSFCSNLGKDALAEDKFNCVTCEDGESDRWENFISPPPPPQETNNETAIGQDALAIGAAKQASTKSKPLNWCGLSDDELEAAKQEMSGGGVRVSEKKKNGLLDGFLGRMFSTSEQEVEKALSEKCARCPYHPANQQKTYKA